MRKKKFKVFVALVLCLALVGGTFYFAGGKDMLKSKADTYGEGEKGDACGGGGCGGGSGLISSLLGNLGNLSSLFGGGGKDGGSGASADLSSLLSGNGLSSIQDLLGNGSLGSLTKLLDGGSGIPNITQLIKTLVTKATQWAKEMFSGLNLKVNNIQKINNADGKDQYAISYTDQEENTPYGYSVLGYDDDTKDFNIDESSIGKGQGDLISSLTKNLKDGLSGLFGGGCNKGKNGMDSLSDINFGGDIFKNGDNYGINVDGLGKDDTTSDTSNKNNIFDMFGNDIGGGFAGGGGNKNGKAGSGAGHSYSSADEIFENAGNLKSGDTTMLKKYEQRPELMDASVAERKVKKYACAVQASTQCAYVEGLTDYNSKLKDTYDKLWSYSNTHSTGGGLFNFGVTYGGTYTSDMAKAFVKFAKEKGKSGTTSTAVEYEPTIDWMKKQIQANRPIIFGYGVDVKGEYCGHCISILGVREAKSGNSNMQYLVVYDSWGTTPKLLNYNKTSFEDCEAAAFDVK